jgi:hypothetical protein
VDSATTRGQNLSLKNFPSIFNKKHLTRHDTTRHNGASIVYIFQHKKMKNIAGFASALLLLSCAPAALAQNPNPLVSLLIDGEKHFIQCTPTTNNEIKEDGLVARVSISEGIYYICMPMSVLNKSWPGGQYAAFDSLLPVEKSAVDLVIQYGGQSNVIRVITPKQ